VAGAAASTIYVVNPFVYGRLHYGQLFLLAGYAVWPWVALRLKRLLLEPRVANAVIAAASISLVGILNLHLFLMTIALVVILVTTFVVGSSSRLSYLKRLIPAILITGAVTLGASAYWLIPLLIGFGPEGTRLAGITIGDLHAFAAIPDQHLGLVPNLLGLYGFWAEAAGRFTPMKAFAPVWPAILTLLLMVCAFGAFTAFRNRDRQLTPWVAGLVVAAILALVLEMGVTYTLTASLTEWLDAQVPPYRGMRDAAKWAAMLALVYSQLGALGAVAILGWLKKWVPGHARSEWVASAATGLLLALPLYYGNGLLYGAHGEIKPSHYPAGWYAADRVLISDGHPGRTLFLPWHQYTSFGFIRNQNKVVAPPGPTFFSVPILASSNPEVVGIGAPNDPDQVAITGLVRARAGGDWAGVLAARGIKYVLLAHELDWSGYSYLDNQAGITKVGDYGSISLYRNTNVP
jgi:hypothetical protein